LNCLANKILDRKRKKFTLKIKKIFKNILNPLKKKSRYLKISTRLTKKSIDYHAALRQQPVIGKEIK
jgi:hypothetical protein